MKRRIFAFIIVVTFFLSSCAQEKQPDITADYYEYTKELLAQDINLLSDRIENLSDEVNAQVPHPLDLYAAFADLDGDGIPEFFYGYHALTSSQNNVWYYAYSLKDHKSIQIEHVGNWTPYLETGEEATFYTNPASFLGGNSFRSDDGKAYFLVDVRRGSAVDVGVTYNKLYWSGSKLIVDTSEQFALDNLPVNNDESFPLRESFGKLNDRKVEDIHLLLETYFAE